MELTRQDPLRSGIMLGGGAALILRRRWFVAMSFTFALASVAHAANGDPRLVQGVLEWPTKLTAEPFVVIRTEDGRWYYVEIKSARRLEPTSLTVGARVAVLGTEAARPHEITALAFGSGDVAALALALMPHTNPPAPWKRFRGRSDAADLEVRPGANHGGGRLRRGRGLSIDWDVLSKLRQ